MSELGISSGIRIIEGAPHGFLAKQVWFDRMIEEADKHFKRTLEVNHSNTSSCHGFLFLDLI